jgi:excinuclease ABC subunit C
MGKFKFIKKENIEKLPAATGVYALSDGNIIYIGKAINIEERVKNHFSRPTFRDNLFIKKVSKIGFIETNSEIEALVLEASLIKKYDPKFNVVWRDDKNYFFVGKTNEKFPQIFITHQTKNLKSNYVGPFVDGRALKETIKFLRKVFPYKSCKTLPKKPCLWFHLNQCPAPCINNKSKIMEVSKIKKGAEKEAQKNVKSIFDILSGKKSHVLADLKKEMKMTSLKQNFEKAKRIKDKINSLERIMEHSMIFQKSTPDDWNKTQIILQKITGVKTNVSGIESYDISNLQGKEAAGSMVTFIDGKPDKNYYRKFKIKMKNEPNDFAMLQEILTRRLNHKEWPYPELMLIDGGKAQLNAATKVRDKNHKTKNIKIISIAKKRNELFIEGKNQPILLKTLPREIFNLILQMRDEAHRFAITYHKKLREKSLILGK